MSGSLKLSQNVLIVPAFSTKIMNNLKLAQIPCFVVQKCDTFFMKYSLEFLANERSHENCSKVHILDKLKTLKSYFRSKLLVNKSCKFIEPIVIFCIRNTRGMRGNRACHNLYGLASDHKATTYTV